MESAGGVAVGGEGGPQRGAQVIAAEGEGEDGDDDVVDAGAPAMEGDARQAVARGRGVADRLVGAAVAFAAVGGCRSVWLETMRGPMDAVIAVYRRNGFDDAPYRAATLGVPGVVVMERPVVAGRRLA